MTKFHEFRLTDRISALIASRKAISSDPDAGMSTVEYAIGIVGAGCAAGVLVKFLQSGAFAQLVKEIVLGSLKKLVSGVF